MRKNPIISVVMPVYNNERYVTAAVESVLKQNLDDENNIELIIVDDGSTDDTPAIVDGFAMADKRVRVVHQNNQWIYASMNNGIRLAEGEYIYVLNSDDLLEKGALRCLIDLVKKYNGPDLICTKVITCNVDRTLHVKSSFDISPGINVELLFDGRDAVHKNFAFLQKSEIIVNQANLYKTQILKQHPFRENIYGADTILNCEIAEDLERVVVCPIPIYRFIQYEDKGNASVGKYYGYEHGMFNDIYFMYKELYQKWDVYDDITKGYLIDKRLKELTYEIETLSFPSCTLSNEEKIEKIFGEIADNKIRAEARTVNREKEYESRVLNGTASAVKRNGIELSGEVSFVKNLIEPLPKFYLDQPDVRDCEALRKCIFNKKNKDFIGQMYYFSISPLDNRII